MPQTPDRSPLPRYEEKLILTDDGYTADNPGEFVFDGSSFSMRDSVGVFNPRSGGALPPATQVGQILFSKDGSTFTVELPITTSGGWLVNNEGTLLVVG
jgi:hypothetical protein